MLDEGRPGSKAGPAVRTARYPLSALGHAVGVVRILIDFQARTKAKWPCQLKPVNLSVAWLFSNTRAGIKLSNSTVTLICHLGGARGIEVSMR